MYNEYLDELLEEAYLEGYYDSMDDYDNYYNESNSATRDLIQQHEKGHADDNGTTVIGGYRVRGLTDEERSGLRKAIANITFRARGLTDREKRGLRKAIAKKYKPERRW